MRKRRRGRTISGRHRIVTIARVLRIFPFCAAQETFCSPRKRCRASDNAGKGIESSVNRVFCRKVTASSGGAEKAGRCRHRDHARGGGKKFRSRKSRLDKALCAIMKVVF